MMEMEASGSNSRKRHRSESPTSSPSSPPLVPEAPESPPADFGRLPDEMLLAVFQYLDYGDRLVARQVSQRWNYVISNWEGFLEHAIFQLRRSPTKNTLATLVKSEVPWRNVALSKFMSSKPPSWYLPPQLNATLTSLILSDGGLAWRWFKDAIARFDRLDKVAIIRCSRIVEEDEGWSQTPEHVAKFLTLLQRLKSLRLEVNDVRVLNFFMRQFTCCNGQSMLNSLEITVQPLPATSNSYKEYEQFTSNFTNLIVPVTNTLKSLTIRTSSRFATHVASSLHLFAERNVTLDLSKFQFQFKRSDNGNPCHLMEREEQRMLEFLSTQQNLKSLALPRFRPMVVNDGPLLGVFPQGLKEMWISHDIFLNSQLFERFQYMKKLKIAIYEPTGLGQLVQAIDHRIFPEMIDLSIGVNVVLLNNFLILIVPAFPNLAHLRLESSRDVDHPCLSISDDNLQVIIVHFPSLRTLHIGSGHLITDYGVTGLELPDCRSLLDLKSIYLEQPSRCFGLDRIGHPLKALKHLKELSIKCIRTKISDVGVYYGFGFRDLRKLEVVFGPEMSDWGLVMLARMNPSLEKAKIVSSTPMLSKGAKQIFSDLLVRCTDPEVYIAH